MLRKFPVKTSERKPVRLFEDAVINALSSPNWQGLYIDRF